MKLLNQWLCFIFVPELWLEGEIWVAELSVASYHTKMVVFSVEVQLPTMAISLWFEMTVVQCTHSLVQSSLDAVKFFVCCHETSTHTSTLIALPTILWSSGHSWIICNNSLSKTSLLLTALNSCVTALGIGRERRHWIPCSFFNVMLLIVRTDHKMWGMNDETGTVAELFALPKRCSRYVVQSAQPQLTNWQAYHGICTYGKAQIYS